VRCHAAVREVSVQEAFDALVYGEAVIIDARTVREYDNEHITKPPKRCFSVPFDKYATPEAFSAAAAKVLGRPLSKGVLMFTAQGGDALTAAADAVAVHGGYTNVMAIAGGWSEWRKHYTATCREAPPAGRWVPTGQEALKSGLMSGDAAMSYEERINVQDLTKVGFEGKQQQQQ
jgi:rhodanese-related sulfurtransferase